MTERKAGDSAPAFAYKMLIEQQKRLDYAGFSGMKAGSSPIYRTNRKTAL